MIVGICISEFLIANRGVSSRRVYAPDDSNLGGGICPTLNMPLMNLIWGRHMPHSKYAPDESDLGGGICPTLNMSLMNQIWGEAYAPPLNMPLKKFEIVCF